MENRRYEFSQWRFPIEFQYLQLDPATFLSGWGAYKQVSGYDFVWDKKFGVPGK